MNLNIYSTTSKSRGLVVKAEKFSHKNAIKHKKGTPVDFSDNPKNLT